MKKIYVSVQFELIDVEKADLLTTSVSSDKDNLGIPKMGWFNI